MVSFRDRLRAGDAIVGTWIKTPHPHVVEVLGRSALDLLVLDAEHAPFDRTTLDLCLLAAGDMPVLVRPASAAHDPILQALDGGATGVIVPHIRSADEARALVQACHYQPGGRGFAGSTRAAGYTTLGMAKHRAAARGVTVIAQIEDAEAVEAIDEIVAVEGIDAIFIGRIDLTISMGAESPDDPAVVAAVEHICNAARRAGRTIGMFVSRTGEVPAWRAQGATMFVLQSDQEFLLKGAAALKGAVG